jgi:hypothetical protein
MIALNKRLKDLEARHGSARPSRYVWLRQGQSPAEALAEAGLPADATDFQFFSWRAPQ